MPETKKEGYKRWHKSPLQSIVSSQELPYLPENVITRLKSHTKNSIVNSVVHVTAQTGDEIKHNDFVVLEVSFSVYTPHICAELDSQTDGRPQIACIEEMLNIDTTSGNSAVIMVDMYELGLQHNIFEMPCIRRVGKKEVVLPKVSTYGIVTFMRLSN